MLGPGKVQTERPALQPALRAKAIQDLCVLAAEIERGTLVKTDDPNFAPLSKAARIIQRLLDHILSGTEVFSTQGPGPQQDNAQLQDVIPWYPLQDQELWDLETGFWQELAGQPSLFDPYSEVQG